MSCRGARVQCDQVMERVEVEVEVEAPMRTGKRKQGVSEGTQEGGEPELERLVARVEGPLLAIGEELRALNALLRPIGELVMRAVGVRSDRGEEGTVEKEEAPKAVMEEDAETREESEWMGRESEDELEGGSGLGTDVVSGLLSPVTGPSTSTM